MWNHLSGLGEHKSTEEGLCTAIILPGEFYHPWESQNSNCLTHTLTCNPMPCSEFPDKSIPP